MVNCSFTFEELDLIADAIEEYEAMLKKLAKTRPYAFSSTMKTIEKVAVKLKKYSN